MITLSLTFPKEMSQYLSGRVKTKQNVCKQYFPLFPAPSWTSFDLINVIFVVEISSGHRTNYYRVISGTGHILQMSNFFGQCLVSLLVCSLVHDKETKNTSHCSKPMVRRKLICPSATRQKEKKMGDQAGRLQ